MEFTGIFALCSSWAKLKEGLIQKRAQLGESQTIQQFSRDADEIENWIAEKLQVASEETYRDPTNIQSKHQKQQAFEAELAANADRIQTLLGAGKSRFVGKSRFRLSSRRFLSVHLFLCCGRQIDRWMDVALCRAPMYGHRVFAQNSCKLFCAYFSKLLKFVHFYGNFR